MITKLLLPDLLLIRSKGTSADVAEFFTALYQRQETWGKAYTYVPSGGEYSPSLHASILKIRSIPMNSQTWKELQQFIDQAISLELPVSPLTNVATALSEKFLERSGIVKRPLSSGQPHDQLIASDGTVLAYGLKSAASWEYAWNQLRVPYERDILHKKGFPYIKNLEQLGDNSLYFRQNEVPFSEEPVVHVGNPGTGQDIRAALVAAIAAAKTGDIVQLPAGSFVLTNKVSITKQIRLRGAGIGKTVLYRSTSASDATLESWGSMLEFDMNSTTSKPWSVSGITFRSKQPSLVNGDGLSRAADMGINILNSVDFVIRNCRFEYFGKAAIQVIHHDSILGGLIQGNQFYRNTKGADGLGLGYAISIYGLNAGWISDPELGSSKFIFVEDNTFDYHRHAIAAGGCAKYVFRHNLVTNNYLGQGAHTIDTHATRGNGQGLNTYGTRAVEVYSNRLINTTLKDGTPILPSSNVQNFQNTGIQIRAGEGVVYSNYIRGYRFGVGMLHDATGTGIGSSYPIRSQPGYKSGVAYGSSHSGTDAAHADGDLFVWSNDFTPFIDSQNHSSSAFFNFSTSNFVQGRDYHLLARPGYTAYRYPHPLTDREF